MAIYALIIAVAVIFGAIVDECKKDERYKSLAKFLVGFIILFMSFFVGVRYYVGTDFGSYMHMFDNYKNYTLGQVFSGREPGIRLIIKICAFFVDDFSFYMTVYSLIVVSLSVITIYKHSSSFMFGTLMYILIGSYLAQCNGMRQMMAVSIVFSGYGFLKEKRFFPYLILCLFAMLFHVSAIIMIPLYFIYTAKTSVPLIFVIAVVSVVLMFSYDRIFDAVAFLRDEESLDISTYHTTSIKILRVAVASAPMLFYLIMYLINKNLLPKNNVLINATVLNAFLFICSANSAYLARAGLFTEIFMCLSVAGFSINMDEKDKYITTVILIICYGAYFYFNTTMSAGLYPYRWVFDYMG